MTTPTPQYPQPTADGQAPTWYVPNGATAPQPLSAAPPPPPGQPPYGQPVYGQPTYGQPPYGQPVYGQPVYGQVPAPQGGKRPNRRAVVAAVVVGVLALGGIVYAVGRDDASSAGDRTSSDRGSDRDDDRTDTNDGGGRDGTATTQVAVPTPNGGGSGAAVPADDVLATAYARLTSTRPSESVMRCLRDGASLAPAELTAVAQGTVADFETAAAGVLTLVDCAPDADAAYGVGESLAYLTGVPWDPGCLQQTWAALDRGSRITLAAESMVDVQGYQADAIAVFGNCQA